VTSPESAQPTAPEKRRAVLLYDRDCRFCRWSLRRVVAWDRRGRLRAVALQDDEANRLLTEMAVARRMESWHLVAPNGEVSSAGGGVAPLLDLLPGGRALAALARASPGTTDRAYSLIARHRSTLGRLIPRRRREA
jgi:predicted DCC family thiol-disulfide oxidoreductase YuxK